jgi:hypothetical protein
MGMAYTHVLDAKMKAQEEVWYMFSLFCCNIIASIIVMMALWLRPNVEKLWVAAGALAALTIGCYVWSRTVGFPEMADHIGDWGDPIGIASLGFEATIAILGFMRVVSISKGTRHLTATAVVLLTMCVLAASASADMEMVGQIAEYPNVAAASSADKRAVTTILDGLVVNIGRYDSVAKAKALGYSFQSKALGIQHMRKHDVTFWGKMLDPAAPQALMWWCAEGEHCTLVGVMYRAPGDRMPPTYGGLLQWHKHASRASVTWMTHVWLTHDTPTALARCVPFAQIEMATRIKKQPYNPDIIEDVPCGSGTSMGMSMGM